MDEFAAYVKDEAPRRHPEDRDDSEDEKSEIDSNATDEELNNEDYVIPGTGPNDMPLLKSSSKLTGGSHQTVCFHSLFLFLFLC
jgi:hypothetical protein